MEIIIKPLADKVLVKPAKAPTKSAGGIALPPSATSSPQPQEGTVVAVGPGRVLDSGVEVPVNIAKDDVVLFAPFGGVALKVDGVDHLLLEASSIWAVKETVPVPAEGAD